MKNPIPLNLFTHSGIALALAMTLALWTPARAESHAPKSGSMMNAGTMTQSHQAMQMQREKMMMEMKAQDAELNAQLAKIKSAPDQQKVDLLVALVGRMIEQRIAMHARMDEMMNQMMTEMPTGSESMSSHGMMKGMDDKDDKPADMTGKNK